MSLEGRTALITGGSAGIGKAIAECFGAAGARVAITARSEDRLTRTREELESLGYDVWSLPCDVSSRTQIQRLVTSLLSDFEQIDILVNNVGALAETFVENPDDTAWERLMKTNLDGPYYLTSRVASRIPDGGRVLFISGVLGKVGVPGSAAYCATKHGIIGFCRSLALELAPRKICVNTLCPGWVDTELARLTMEKIARDNGISYEEVLSGALKQVPLGELIPPSEVAELARFLAGKGGRNITGQAYNISGGQIMH